MFDAVIVGGGPVGLQAAISLGRYRRSVLVIDRGKGRGYWVPAYYNLLGHPGGISGRELLERGRKQIEELGVQYKEATVTAVERTESPGKLSFRVTAEKDGVTQKYCGRRLILATGIVDDQPDIPEVFKYAGKSLYYCPDCDGYEVKDRPTAVLGPTAKASGLAKALTQFTPDVKVVTADSPDSLNRETKAELESRHISVFHGTVREIRAVSPDCLEALVLDNGTVVSCEKLFSARGAKRVNSGLAARLGVKINEDGHIPVDPRTKATNVAGVHAVGDVVASTQMLLVGIGEAAQAALWINRSLLEEGSA